MLRFSLLLLWIAVPQTSPPQLRVEAPPTLAAEKAQLEASDSGRMEKVMRLVGLQDPGPPIHIELVPESSDLARSVDPWVAGFARQDKVVIFPSRSPSYPDNDLDDVLRHEVAHVLIFRSALGQPVPRWFNEGLAMAVERRRGFRDQTQLFLHLVSGSRLSLAEIDRLFEGGQAEQTRAYSLSGALIQSLLDDNGETAGGRILELVRNGASFETAFTEVTGQSTRAAQEKFWESQRVWTTWIPIVFSQEVLWMFVTLLVILAVVRRRKRNAELRKRWEEELDG